MTALSTLPPRVAHPGRVADRPDPEVPERARRRTFTAQYKLDVLAEYEAADPGGKGAILRREGLYSSHIVEWRPAARGRGAGRSGPASGPPSGRPAGGRTGSAAPGQATAGA